MAIKGGKQKKRCENNIKEWTGTDFATSAKAAGDRTSRKGIAVVISGAPKTSQLGKILGQIKPETKTT